MPSKIKSNKPTDNTAISLPLLRELLSNDKSEDLYIGAREEHGKPSDVEDPLARGKNSHIIYYTFRGPWFPKNISLYSGNWNRLNWYRGWNKFLPNGRPDFIHLDGEYKKIIRRYMKELSTIFHEYFGIKFKELPMTRSQGLPRDKNFIVFKGLSDVGREDYWLRMIPFLRKIPTIKKRDIKLFKVHSVIRAPKIARHYSKAISRIVQFNLEFMPPEFAETPIFKIVLTQAVVKTILNVETSNPGSILSMLGIPKQGTSVFEPIKKYKQFQWLDFRTMPRDSRSIMFEDISSLLSCSTNQLEKMNLPPYLVKDIHDNVNILSMAWCKEIQSIMNQSSVSFKKLLAPADTLAIQAKRDQMLHGSKAWDSQLYRNLQAETQCYFPPQYEFGETCYVLQDSTYFTYLSFVVAVMPLIWLLVVAFSLNYPRSRSMSR